MTGKIVSISLDIINVEFPKGKLPQLGVILKVDNGTILSAESVKDDRTLITVIIKKTGPLSIGGVVTSTGKPIQAPVGQHILGRIFNTIGEPLDGKEMSKNLQYVDTQIYKSLEKGFIQKNKLLKTGIKALDFFIPSMVGDKIGMFGGAGVGKTLVIKEIINNITKSKDSKKYSSIYAGIGERSREGEEIYRELEKSRLLKDVALFFAQMNETSGSRMKLIYTAIAAAEYFRDVEQQDSLVFIDNIYRFTQAGSELSSSLGNIPSQSGYQPTLMTEISNVEERLSNSTTGSITSFQTVFVPADDVTDPATVNIFSHLDGSMVLDRNISSAGRYPAINPLSSYSNNLTVNMVGQRHVDAVMNVKKHLQRFEELEDLLAILGVEGISKEDRLTIERARKLANFFTQDFHTAEVFTQRKGTWVDIDSVIESVERIMDGEFDKFDPTDFLYITTVDEIKVIKNEISEVPDLMENNKKIKIKNKKIKENKQ